MRELLGQAVGNLSIEAFLNHEVSFDIAIKISIFMHIFSIRLGVRLYLWGICGPSSLLMLFSEKANGRLANSDFPRSRALGVPFPTQVRLPGVRIVSLVAGGMYVNLYLSSPRTFIGRLIKGHSMLWTQMATFMSGVCVAHVSAKNSG